MQFSLFVAVLATWLAVVVSADGVVAESVDLEAATSRGVTSEEATVIPAGGRAGSLVDEISAADSLTVDSLPVDSLVAESLLAESLLAGTATPSTPLASSKGPAPVDFVRDIQPIMRRNCWRCHGSKRQEGGLRLDRREAAFQAGDSSRVVIVKHRAQQSLLIQRLSDPDCGDLMPLDGEPLADDELLALRRWIDEGAVWPDQVAEPRHWAYRPIVRPEIPDPIRTDLDRSAAPRSKSTVAPIDAFINLRLAADGLEMSPEAARPQLIRRLSLALIGLPPSPAEVEAFVADKSPGAYEKVVDRLLASPHYGERWAVPWLDLARYADSNGYQADQLRDNWAYRDWVIRALNDDLPYDQFVIDQLAGDLRPDATLQQKIATGFHRMTPCNVEAGVHPEANRINQIVDRVNATATVFLGTTLECAQCHDHKYDPFTQRDYYRLFAYFNNTPLEVKHTSGVTWDFFGPKLQLPVDQAQRQRREALQRELELLSAEPQDLATPTAHDEWRKGRIAELEQLLEQLQPTTTLIMEEMPERRETYVLNRGDYRNRADRVSPGTPQALPAVRDIEPTGDRLELARWLTSPENPLLARVGVNRLWGELFGVRLVATAEDFGTQAETPSHPRLLDWLAAEWIESGWSTKHVQKLIVMSAAYRQTAKRTPTLQEADPENRLYAYGPRFRLPAELVRDNCLAISGLLSTTMYGPPIMPFQPAGIWRSVGRNQPTWKNAENDNRFRRGVYVIHKRAAPYPSFVNFDAPDRSSCTVSRPTTNTPLQALTLLNDPAYAEMALAFADRVLHERYAASDEEKIDYALRLALSRPGRPEEIALFRRLLEKQRQAMLAVPELVQARVESASSAWRPNTDNQAELAAWFALTQVVLNLDETMTN